MHNSTGHSDIYRCKIHWKVLQPYGKPPASKCQKSQSLKKGVNLIRECIDANGRACQGTDTLPKVSWMNIHVCISYASLQQTAGKHLARMLMEQTNSPSLPPSQPPLTAVLDSASFPLLTPTINPAHSTLPSVSSFHLTSHLHIPFLSLPPLFLQHHSSFSTVSSVLRILTHMAGFDDFTSLCGPPPPVPGWPRCLLIILSSAQPEALSTSNLFPFYQTNPPHMLLHASFRDHYHLRSQHWTPFSLQLSALSP